MNKNITNIGRLTISVLLVIGLIYIVGLEKIISTISKFNIFFIPIVFFLMFVTLALSGFNLKLLFNAKSQIKNKEFFKDFCSSWATGFIVPGKIGEFYLGYLLRKKLSIASSSAIILLDKLITLLIISILGILSLILFLEQEIAILMSGFLLLLWIIGLLALFLPTWRQLILTKIIPKKYAQSFTGFFDTLKYFLKFEKKRIFLNFLLTLVKIALQGYTFVIIFEGLGVQSQLFEIILITSAVTILSFIPITSGGIGLKEGAFAFLALKIGLPIDAAVSNTLISTVINYIIVGLLAIIFLDRNIKNKLK